MASFSIQRQPLDGWLHHARIWQCIVASPEFMMMPVVEAAIANRLFLILSATARALPESCTNFVHREAADDDR